MSLYVLHARTCASVRCEGKQKKTRKRDEKNEVAIPASFSPLHLHDLALAGILGESRLVKVGPLGRYIGRKRCRDRVSVFGRSFGGHLAGHSPGFSAIVRYHALSANMHTLRSVPARFFPGTWLTADKLTNKGKRWKKERKLVKVRRASVLPTRLPLLESFGNDASMRKEQRHVARSLAGIARQKTALFC